MPYNYLLNNKNEITHLKGKRVRDALTKKGFKSCYYNSRTEALDYILGLIPERSKVGIGGSVTVRQLGLLDILHNKGYEVFDHWVQTLTKEETEDVRRKHLTCDIFITSTNAITKDGTLINIDNTGNRVAAMIFGPKRTIVVAGINKIVNSIEEGLKRIRDQVVPPTIKRHGKVFPCIKEGFCVECNLPDRFCRITTIIELCPKGNKDFHVILVGEELGF
jgi:L-lactate utilization protein LutB